MTSVIRGNDNFDSAQALPVLVTAQTAAGTSVDFTGIPSWAKRITVMFNGVSTNGTSVPIIQIGSGSVQTTGYSSAALGSAGTAVANATFTSGFGFEDNGSAAISLNGSALLTLLGSNIWTINGIFQRVTSGIGFGAGSVTLTGTLDRVRITTVNGTDTFDAGSISIMYQ